MGILKAIHKWVEPYKYDNDLEMPTKKDLKKRRMLK